MSAGELAFEICAGIIENGAGWPLCEVAGGVTRSSTVRRGEVLDRRIDNFITRRNGKADSRDAK